MTKSRIASIQMTSSHDLGQNLLMATELIRNACEQGAQFIVLPENFAMMGLQESDKLKFAESFGQGPIQDFLRTQAAENRVWIVGGTIPIKVPSEENKVYASCLVFNDEGLCVSRYDKIHMFDVSLHAGEEKYSESRATQAGDQVVVIPTPFGKVGLSVCYDIRFPELFRQMQKENVEIIVLPAAFTYTTGSVHWEVLVRARAIENLAYVVASCQTGTHSNNRKTYGHSMIVNPWGEILAVLPHEPGVVVADIDLEVLKKIRNEFPSLEHRKLFT